MYKLLTVILITIILVICLEQLIPNGMWLFLLGHTFGVVILTLLIRSEFRN